MSKQDKPRLDSLMVELGLADTRSKAQALIMAGQVTVKGEVRDKPGLRLPPDSDIQLKERQKYVSRGGLKLEPAFDGFGVSPDGKVCLDVGASTGGFTDLMLQRGAKKVYAVDVGKGQLDWKLRNDERVVVLEGVNARHLSETEAPERVGLAVIDVSFISLELILPAIVPLIDDGASIVALVKPQFEVGKGQVGKGGVVRDLEVIDACVEKISSFASSLGLSETGRLPSPIKGPKGNQEWLLILKR